MKTRLITFFIFTLFIVCSGIGCGNYDNSDNQNSMNASDSINDKIEEQKPPMGNVRDVFDISQLKLNNWLGIGVEQRTVIEKLGNADSISPKKYWEALGSYVNTMHYYTSGYVFEIEHYETETPRILSITLTKSCKAELPNGIKIGSTRTNVLEYYKHHIDSDNSSSSKILVGSLYNGILFTTEEDKVIKIFIGALAE
jgi:hypothetical protein